MNVNAVWRVAAIALVAIGTASGCTPEPSAEGERVAPTAVVRARGLEPREFAPRIEAPGQWRASGEFRVTAPFAATVESLGARVGDRVAQGERIAWLVTRESQAAVRGAELMQRQADDSASRAEAARALALARRDVVRVPLVAGRAGTVAGRLVEPGAEIAEGAELFTLVPSGALVFEAHVPLADASRVVAGRQATIAMEAGSVIAAEVRTRVPGTSAADQTMLVWLAPRGAAPPELIDRFGRASIETGERRRAIAVPDSAVVEDDLTGEQRVAVVEASGVAVWTAVRLGMGQDGWHELLAPALPSGTRVVVSGQRGLPDSTRVRVEP